MAMRTHWPIFILMALCCGACQENFKLVHPPLVAKPVESEVNPATAARSKRKSSSSLPTSPDNSLDLTNQLRDPDLLNKLDDPEQNPAVKTPNKGPSNKPVIIKGSSTPPELPPAPSIPKP